MNIGIWIIIGIVVILTSPFWMVLGLFLIKAVVICVMAPIALIGDLIEMIRGKKK